ncbi:hypothetical protein [Roseateles sp. LYH14W]|uniref:Uncharacterized protein n=1 Tax=Pelomonas parva TaxID=3299032 RepID=A0ABW7F528_9BURK
MIVERVAKFTVAVVGALIALAALGAGLVYFQLYGEHEFSAADFEDATGQKLPASARILKGESRGWDLRGDHDACALIKLSQADYERLLAAIRPGTGSDNASPCSAEMYAAFARYTVRAAESTSKQGGSYYAWALADGQSVVMVEYSSW